MCQVPYLSVAVVVSAMVGVCQSLLTYWARGQPVRVRQPHRALGTTPDLEVITTLLISAMTIYCTEKHVLAYRRPPDILKTAGNQVGVSIMFALNSAVQGGRLHAEVKQLERVHVLFVELV